MLFNIEFKSSKTIISRQNLTRIKLTLSLMQLLEELCKERIDIFDHLIFFLNNKYFFNEADECSFEKFEILIHDLN